MWTSRFASNWNHVWATIESSIMQKSTSRSVGTMYGRPRGTLIIQHRSHLYYEVTSTPHLCLNNIIYTGIKGFLCIYARLLQICRNVIWHVPFPSRHMCSIWVISKWPVFCNQTNIHSFIHVQFLRWQSRLLWSDWCLCSGPRPFFSFFVKSIFPFESSLYFFIEDHFFGDYWGFIVQ